ncbi:hypothetical protein E4U32_004204 [Claviceps aff. humidiphila group G2b]|nr:hypothetical protein E4U32_004204 [Claviceps aff. humidiphila group G2b]
MKTCDIKRMPVPESFLSCEARLDDRYPKWDGDFNSFENWLFAVDLPLSDPEMAPRLGSAAHVCGELFACIPSLRQSECAEYIRVRQRSRFLPEGITPAVRPPFVIEDFIQVLVTAFMPKDLAARAQKMVHAIQQGPAQALSLFLGDYIQQVVHSSRPPRTHWSGPDRDPQGWPQRLHPYCRCHPRLPVGGRKVAGSGAPFVDLDKVLDDKRRAYGRRDAFRQETGALANANVLRAFRLSNGRDARKELTTNVGGAAEAGSHLGVAQGKVHGEQPVLKAVEVAIPLRVPVVKTRRHGGGGGEVGGRVDVGGCDVAAVVEPVVSAMVEASESGVSERPVKAEMSPSSKVVTGGAAHKAVYHEMGGELRRGPVHLWLAIAMVVLVGAVGAAVW